jgi:FLYWCH zinc finger domain
MENAYSLVCNMWKVYTRPTSASDFFLRERGSIDAIAWKCSRYQSNRCNARVKTHHDYTIISTKNEHNHAANPVDVAVEEKKEELRKKAVGSTDAPHKIISEASIGVSEAVAIQMPTIQSQKRTINKQRQVASNAPIVTNLEELVIPEYFKFLGGDESAEKNLLYDGSIENMENSRVLIFATQQTLQILADSATWYADGTEKMCPAPFSQVYTIHADHEGHVIPVVYSLLSGKLTKIYNHFFAELLQLKPGMKPERLLIDFERAVMAAARKTLNKDIDILCCYVHFARIVWRKAETFKIAQHYNEREEVQGRIKKIIALAYLPVGLVTRGFELLLKEEFANCPPEVEDFLAAFESEFIGQKSLRGDKRLNATFPIQLWNNHEVRNLGLYAPSAFGHDPANN